MNVVVVFFYNFFRRVKYKIEIPGSELALYKDSSQERVGIVVTGVFAAASSSSWAVVSSAENNRAKCGLAMKDKLYIVHRRYFPTISFTLPVVESRPIAAASCGIVTELNWLVGFVF